MDAKRCDRCKRFYLETDNVKKRPSYAGHRLFSIRTLNSNWDRLSTYDVCPDCAYDFIMNWMSCGSEQLVDAKYSGPELESEVLNETN